MLVRDTAGHFELSPLLDILTTDLVGKDNLPTKMAEPHWTNMLPKKRKGDMGQIIPKLLPILLRTLFQMILNAVLGLFASVRIYLEIKGSLIV